MPTYGGGEEAGGACANWAERSVPARYPYCGSNPYRDVANSQWQTFSDAGLTQRCSETRTVTEKYCADEGFTSTSPTMSCRRGYHWDSFMEDCVKDATSTSSTGSGTSTTQDFPSCTYGKEKGTCRNKNQYPAGANQRYVRYRCKGPAHIQCLIEGGVTSTTSSRPEAGGGSRPGGGTVDTPPAPPAPSSGNGDGFDLGMAGNTKSVLALAGLGIGTFLIARKLKG